MGKERGREGKEEKRREGKGGLPLF